MWWSNRLRLLSMSLLVFSCFEPDGERADGSSSEAEQGTGGLGRTSSGDDRVTSSAGASGASSGGDLMATDGATSPGEGNTDDESTGSLVGEGSNTRDGEEMTTDACEPGIFGASVFGRACFQ